jgi:DNA methylase
MTKAKSALDVNVANINQTYGSLTTRVHDAGYTLGRAFEDLEKLIEGNDWRLVSGGFDDINQFMDSVKLDHFRLIADQRKSIVARIKRLQPDVSNRRIAKALGASDMTIGRDLATDVAGGEENGKKTKGAKTNDATSVALDGWEAAKLVQRRDERSKRIAAAAADKVQRVSGEGTIECRLGDFCKVLADLRGIDAIITDPPYEKKFLPRLRDLAILADRILKLDGVMAVLCGKQYLPEVYSQLAGSRPYRWTACYFAPGASNVNFDRNVVSQWKPLLIYGGCQKRFHDVFRSNLADAQVGQHRHKWGQDMEAFKSIIEGMTEPGDLIVDPFAGGGTTLLAAKSTGRNAIGAEIDATCGVFKLEQLTTYSSEGTRVISQRPTADATTDRPDALTPP